MELPQDIKEYLESVRIVTPGEMEILRLAVEALGDLGACDDEECDCDQCLRALPILKRTMRDLEVKMRGPVCGSGIGSEVGLATDPSRLTLSNLTERKTCDQCGVTAKWSSADCPICFGRLTQKTPSPPPQSPPGDSGETA